MTDQAPSILSIDTDALIGEYVQLRNHKKQAEEEFEEFCKENYSLRMREIENQLLGFINATGQDSCSSRASGTAYRNTKTSVTIGDVQEFQHHVIGAEDWDLLNWSANKTEVEDRLKKGDPLPPGVKWSSYDTIGIRKAKKNG